MSATVPPRLAVLILARNAARILPATIAAAKNFADEVLVLDTGSTDDTVAVAWQAGAKVARYAWQDSFAEARNAALAQTSADWVLWLDAGETLETAAGEMLKKFLREEADENQAYCALITTPAEAGNLGGEQIARIRLHPRRDGLRFEGRVRETLLPALATTGMTVETLALHIERSAREHDPTVKAERAERNIRLAEMEIADRGPSPERWNILGEAYQILGRYAESVNCYQQAKISAEPKSATLLEAYYGLLTTRDASGADRRQQLHVCMEAIEHFPLDAQLLCAMGGYLQSLGEPQLAARSYDVALRHGRIEIELWHMPNILELAVSCQARLWAQQGEPATAVRVLEEGLLQFPASHRLVRQKLDLELELADEPAAQKTAQRLGIAANWAEVYTTAIRGSCEAARGNWIAARAYLDTALRSGLRETFCYRWLAVTQLALSQFDAATETLNHWLTHEPQSAEAHQFRQSLERLSNRDLGTRRIDVAAAAVGDGPATRMLRMFTSSPTAKSS